MKKIVALVVVLALCSFLFTPTPAVAGSNPDNLEGIAIVGVCCMVALAALVVFMPRPDSEIAGVSTSVVDQLPLFVAPYQGSDNEVSGLMIGFQKRF
ncbi:MAG: hypothetical protein JRJ59_10950 [Deltaproteobacteria bacterium]|nr:hypothetical protein [Deltaproteobacteria bacterium]